MPDSILIALITVPLLLLIVVMALALCLFADRQRDKFQFARVRARVENFNLDTFEAQHALNLPHGLRELYKNKALLLLHNFFIPQPSYETTRYMWHIRFFLLPDDKTVKECRKIIEQGYFPFAKCGDKEYYAVSLRPDVAGDNPVYYFYGKKRKKEQEAGSLRRFFSRLQESIPPLEI